MSQVSDSNSYSASFQRQQDAYDAERAESRTENEKQIQKVREEYEKSIQKSQAESNKQIQNIRADAQGEVRRLKEEMYDSKGKTRQLEGRDLIEEKQRLIAYKEILDQDADRKVENANESAERRAEVAESNEGRKVNEAVADQKKSQSNAVGELRQELDLTNQAHQNEIKEFRESQNHLSDYYASRAAETESRVNERAEKQINTQKKEFQQIDHDHQIQAERLAKAQQQTLDAEKRQHDSSSKFLMAQNNESINRTLGEKDHRYQEYLKGAKAQNDQELATRDQQITKLKTTQDEREVSPALINKIDKAYTERNMALADELNRQNQTNFEASRLRDASDRRELKGDFEKKYTEFNRHHQANQDVEKKAFLTSYTDLQYQKDQEVGQLQKRHAQVFDAMTAKTASELDLQQKRNKEQIEVQAENFHAEKGNLQDDFEFQQKSQNREMSMKFNDLRRDFEKKMTDEHEKNETAMSDLKLEYDKKLREQDRKANRFVDDRVRAYEHQIKQQELSFKEKERFLTEHYEEELAKMKNTNARIIQKKS